MTRPTPLEHATCGNCATVVATLQVSKNHCGVFPYREAIMPTPAPPRPLTSQIMSALISLRAARYDGNCNGVTVAEARFRRLLDDYGPPARTLAELDPDLDARLRVNWKAHR